jgi:hypothetical protein
MSTAFTPTRTRITTNRYQMMVAAGVLTQYDRIELIEGDMLYVRKSEFAAEETVVPQAFPNIKIVVGEIFG